ncbi:DUF4870 domain-containing protein [Paenibacillus sp. MER TA 81-3]|uniref:DUF4870 domain-containing protein n=1 Tax=Paenibacillus sp. MER TA 81-3 TaxID=2939573 RepID=UPI00203F0210|nr:DUF4870 domain-containing protein [Paenibacillus sp. MER TA 81-3]MCM3339087.1 DUF4870 domain-containing protein [Paenibacillus sp. MER TA 81-3]
MSTRYILSSLSYFSIFFAGFILPLVIWLVASDPYIKHHAGRALFSHIIPYAFIVLAIISLITAQFLLSIGFVIIMGVASLFIFIWNVIMGVRVLREGGAF